MEQGTIEIVVRFFVLTVSLTVHEFSHAWSANRLGDDTAARMGRMSLNPLVHLDPVGSLLILTGMPLGWAKPVPVDFLRLRDPRRGGALVALAGPASNFLMGILFSAVFLAMSYQAGGTGWFQLLNYFIQINFSLAIFNLLPLYPLDGSKVLPMFLPRHAAERYEETIGKFGFWPLLLLFLLELPGFRGPLHLWFDLWNPVLRPVLRVFGVPSFW
jgi:Zn-dependent protease